MRERTWRWRLGSDREDWETEEEEWWKGRRRGEGGWEGDGGGGRELGDGGVCVGGLDEVDGILGHVRCVPADGYCDPLLQDRGSKKLSEKHKSISMFGAAGSVDVELQGTTEKTHDGIGPLPISQHTEQTEQPQREKDLKSETITRQRKKGPAPQIPVLGSLSRLPPDRAL